MITVTFQAANLIQLRTEMYDFLGPQTTIAINPPTPVTLTVEPTPPPVNSFAPKAPDVEPFNLDVNKQPEKRTRRTKAQIEADNAAKLKQQDEALQEKANGAQAEYEEEKAKRALEEESAPVVSKEGVHMALQEVNKSCGLNVAREILSEFKVNRISEITEAQYADFIAKCRTAVMMA